MFVTIEEVHAVSRPRGREVRRTSAVDDNLPETSRQCGVTVDPFATPVTSVASAWSCSSGLVLAPDVLLTFTLIEAEPAFLAASYALTINVCEPLVAVVLFHEKLNEGAVALAYSAPSAYNSTLVTPTLSEAAPDTGTAVPETVAPGRGELIFTVGGMVSELLTVTAIEAEPTLPTASYALTVSVCEPLAAVPLIQENTNAEAVPLA